MSISRKCRYSESVVFPKYLTPHGMPHSTPSGFVAVTNSQIRKEMRNDSCQTLHEVLLIGFFSCREENHYAGSILNTLVFMQRSTEIASPCSGHFKLLSFDRNFNGNVRSQERIYNYNFRLGVVVEPTTTQQTRFGGLCQKMAMASNGGDETINNGHNRTEPISQTPSFSNIV